MLKKILCVIIILIVVLNMFAGEISEKNSKKSEIENKTQDVQSVSKTDDIMNVFSYSFLHGILVNLGLIPVTAVFTYISFVIAMLAFYSTSDSCILIMGMYSVISLAIILHLIAVAFITGTNSESISELYSSYDISEIPTDSEFDIIKYNKLKSYKNMMKNVSCAGSALSFVIVSVIVLFTLSNG
ncbi:MAG: hypothetical protein AB7T10_07420 [bacterium]